jgi:hypothetical protein
LTLDTVTFLAAARRSTDFGAAFFVLAVALVGGLALAEDFLVARALAAALRASGLAAVALRALGLDSALRAFRRRFNL